MLYSSAVQRFYIQLLANAASPWHVVATRLALGLCHSLGHVICRYTKEYFYYSLEPT
jgi:hypothetical protein